MWRHCVNCNALYNCNEYYYKKLINETLKVCLISGIQLYDLHKLLISLWFIWRWLTVDVNAMNYVWPLGLWYKRTSIYTERV